MATVEFVRKMPVKLRSGLLVGLLSAAQERKKEARQHQALRAAVKSHLGGELDDLLSANRFEKRSGQSLFVPAAKKGAPCVLLLGYAAEKRGQANNYFQVCRTLGHEIARAARKAKADNVLVDGSSLQDLDVAIDGLVEGLLLGDYTFSRYRSSETAKQRPLRVSIYIDQAMKSSIIDVARVRASAVVAARDLVNIPPCDLTPALFVKQAREVAKKHRLRIRVFDFKALKRMGAGGIVTVGKGSDVPPSLVCLTHKPRRVRKGAPVVALVGKGVTFDSGGLSLKTGDGMMTMKCDMAGAAAVLMTMSCLARLKLDIEVRAYLPIVENMVNGGSVRPGDVYRALNKKTVEVLNTDAEGRLILGDALALAVREGCDEVIDLATLTGACMVALGSDIAGLYASNEALGKRLLAAAERAGEPLWQLPLFESYRSLLKSQVADIKNIGGRYGGSITAALFLSEFVGKTPWAHLDIAGPAFAEKAEGHIGYGGTGYGVATLIRYLLSR